MPVIRMTSEDKVFDIDFGRFTLGEAIALQERAGLDINGLGDKVASGKDLEAIGAAMWLMQVRRIAAEKGMRVRDAAAEVDYETFVDELDLVTLRVETIPGPKDPSPGTPRTRTRPAGSSATRPRGRSAGTSGSERSPST